MKKLLFSALSLAAAVSLNATVFATVNGAPITEAEVAPHIAALGKNPATLSNQEKQMVLARAIDIEILAAEAKKSGVTNLQEYKDALKAAQDRIAIEMYQHQLSKQIKVSDADIAKFYNENKSAFVEPAALLLSNITVEKKAEADAIIKELKNTKADALVAKFEELAVAKSIVPEAKQTKGHLAWVTQEMMPKAFWDASSKLKRGAITQTPIKTDLGYHIVLKEDAKLQKQLSQDEAKPFIENLIKGQQAGAALEQKLQELRKSAKVEVK
ncbi:peptidyl-prolyl cis-trans isomerase [Campylobacter sp. JMF_02 ED1]|uniref:peptidylprolyl isomerase n=1 Tax=unclassified Campylobacter TaxID=2593542 RepID=UPI0022E9F2D1|nr:MULTISPECIES: peptidyl-prolyl cis-trans isomerase [unclassified Campylobacter]MDA3049192.1 peptidyl-prolyl cis-trans isomerase [Campylobacter sp. JMF_15 NE4]MDA3051383.1 peptidyl-prolyl cis-trans isomerase [Campylobacter sp. JMF_02 ED1]